MKKEYKIVLETLDTEPFWVKTRTCQIFKVRKEEFEKIESILFGDGKLGGRKEPKNVSARSKEDRGGLRIKNG